MYDNLGYTALYQGNFDRARWYFRESLLLNQKMGHLDYLPSDLEGFAAYAIAIGQPVYAARLYGKAQVMREIAINPIPPLNYPFYMHYVNAGRAQLPEPAFSAAWAEGRAMSVEQAVAYALTEEKPAPVALG